MSTRLEQAIQKLTPEQVRSVEDYAEFLAAGRARPATPASEPKFDWVGGLKHVDPEKSSVEVMDEVIRSMGQD